MILNTERRAPPAGLVNFGIRFHSTLSRSPLERDKVDRFLTHPRLRDADIDAVLGILRERSQKETSVRGFLNTAAGKVVTAILFVEALGAPRKWS